MIGVLLGVFSLLAAGRPTEFDLLVRGGRVVDGTGNPSYLADVGIKEGRIAAVGNLAGATAARTLDAEGLVVTPGFVDIHNHSDDSLLVDGNGESMIRQGVTSLILGEGLSAAPSEKFPGFQAYFARVRASGISPNIGSYVGSGQVWTQVHGEKAGPATPAELDRMRALVREAMEQGALGVSSSLSGPPGSWIDTATLVALCEAAAPYGGIYSTHIRNEGLGVFEAVAEAVERLQDPALRPRIEREILGGIPGWYNHYTATGSWEGMLLVSLVNPEFERFEGKRMSEVIAALGGKAMDALFQVLIANGGSVPTVYFHHAEEDMRHALRQPFVSIGSDGTAVKTEGPLASGNPHPRYYGTFPRVLGRYVREEKLLSLEEAVRKMTSANTAKVHVYDRGLLRPGQWADVTVFDAARIIDRATFEKPHQYASGVVYVVVNGQVVLDGGRHTGARPGTILYGQGKGHVGRPPTPPSK